MGNDDDQKEPPRRDPAKTCANCTNHAALQNQCRKNPPKVFLVPGGPNGVSFVSTFPPTKPTDWCGSFAGLLLADGN